jgi:hypothetical protein
MRLIFLLPFILLVGGIHAQQIFHGSIVYKYHIAQLPYAPEVTVIYGQNKIKVKFKEKEEYDKVYFLIDLDSGKSFTINEATKTFFARELIDTTTAEQPITKTIAGHKANRVKLKNQGFSKFGVWFSGDIILFTASDLYYPVPEKFVGIPELIMIQDNHIVLRAEQNLEPGEGMSDSIKQQASLAIEAIKINEEQINMAEFSIPADFTKRTRWIGSDSIITVTDTVYSQEIFEIPPPPPPKKKTESKPPTPKKTTPQKGEATKPNKR